MAKYVRGSDELNRAFVLAGQRFNKEKKRNFEYLALPVKADAQARARSMGVGVPWSAQRMGATAQTAYVAPMKRGTRIGYRKRPTFVWFMLSRVYHFSIEAQRPEVIRRYDALLARLVRFWERGS